MQRRLAGSARARRTSRTAGIDTAVACARAFVAEHGCLALVTKNISYQGFLLGKWLTAQRCLTRRQDEPGAHGWACDAGPGLAHARAYASAHGHLATPQTARPEGFALGRWLSEQRHQAREHHRSTGGTWPVSTLLAALDPWWNPTWPLDGQCIWSRVRKRSESASSADAGGTGIADLERTWACQAR
ncbi:helicase associated domain-containing protein [Streptomyces sp. NPDC007907]|uniref:helicase associated domain-containing protein n=1 Tax=Streptomyces sp. NPDC007907 TaxID=3364789 RepID=UPI0036E3E4E4